MARGSPRIWKQKTRLEPVPFNDKIADINEADTNKHTLDLETALSETRKIVSIEINAVRVSGTGEFDVYPNEGTYRRKPWYWDRGTNVIIKDGTQRLQYAQTVIGDDWDLHCFGYVVET